MQRPLTVSGTVVVPADPDTVYALVADPVRMARWSPENTGATPARPGPALAGDRFVGTNTRRGFSWVTECVVTAAEPGRRFAFTVTGWGLRRPALRIANASWEYRLAPRGGGGTEVTETWVDDRPWPDLLCRVVDPLVTGGSMFSDFQRRNIRTTLDRLRDDVGAA